MLDGNGLKKIEARYKIDPVKIFQTSVALWGPTATGKTWLVHAFGRTLYSKYNKPVNGLVYDFKTITGYNFSMPPEDIPGTAGSSPFEYLFERARISFDDTSQFISSFKHKITIFDDKGFSTVDYRNLKNNTLINMADSDIVVIALDPTRVMDEVQIKNLRQGVFSPLLVDSENYEATTYNPVSQKEYAEMVQELFSTLEELRPDKKRYYAVCVMKADQIPKAANNKQEGLIRLYFGQEMINALQIPDKERVKIFTVSSFGFIANKDSIHLKPNFSGVSLGLLDKERWEPCGVEFPLFWAFEKIEMASLQKNLFKNWWRKLTLKSQLKKYIHYPEDVFMEPTK
jgi:hypothetical protein